MQRFPPLFQFGVTEAGAAPVQHLSPPKMFWPIFAAANNCIKSNSSGRNQMGVWRLQSVPLNSVIILNSKWNPLEKKHHRVQIWTKSKILDVLASTEFDSTHKYLQINFPFLKCISKLGRHEYSSSSKNSHNIDVFLYLNSKIRILYNSNMVFVK